MDVLQTPDSRFEKLPGYPFAPHYHDVAASDTDKMRMHYVDEGPSDGPPIVLLHGEPTWSYLYRTMIPPLVEGGHRVLVPDLIGFGRSDKPRRVEDYTYLRHVEWVTSWFDSLDLREVTLFGQDWGSLIGLRIAAEQSVTGSRESWWRTGSCRPVSSPRTGRSGPGAPSHATPRYCRPDVLWPSAPSPQFRPMCGPDTMRPSRTRAFRQGPERSPGWCPPNPTIPRYRPTAPRGTRSASGESRFSACSAPATQSSAVRTNR
jgi:haloalkane dehalogenase